ncbi:MAG: proline dehydrogenase family protein [Ignavibacteria bacterium]|nr:proline dehydrogenase family protein [Ignavibacteria bacterium]
MELLNQIIIKLMPMVPKSIIRRVSRRYIAGDYIQDAIRVSQEIMKLNGMTTIDVLGEFVTTREMALKEAEMCSKVLDAIWEHRLDSYLSVKPTSLGIGIDFEFGYSNIRKLVEKANNLGLFVRLDMENSPYTDSTFEVFRKLRSEGFQNVGIVVQAYLYRSESDIKNLAPLKPSIRLCKGIYRESPTIAIQDREGIRNNFKKLLNLILELGLYPAIATHDEPLIKYSIELVEKYKLKREDYEFQMLLGVREERRNELLRLGHRLRVYVPFGEDWYGYSTRRLKENPDIAGYIFKALLFKNG